MLLENKVMTKNQQDFIGTTFTTPKGGLLTVVGVDSGKGANGKWNNKYILKCSICSLDQELWKDGSIKSAKGELVSNSVPCGCSTTKWTEEQNLTRVRRSCNDKGYTFHGWSGEYKGNTTRLSLYNPQTGNRWTSTTIVSLLKGSKDPKEAVESSRKNNRSPDNVHIKSFIEAGFTDDYVFWRSDRVDSRGE